MDGSLQSNLPPSVCRNNRRQVRCLDSLLHIVQEPSKQFICLAYRDRFNKKMKESTRSPLDMFKEAACKTSTIVLIMLIEICSQLSFSTNDFRRSQSFHPKIPPVCTSACIQRRLRTTAQSSSPRTAMCKCLHMFRRMYSLLETFSFLHARGVYLSIPRTKLPSIRGVAKVPGNM